jgi:hypothetical protein
MSVESAKVTRRWYHWYAPDDGPDERRLILKLDLLIVPFAFIGYWLKYVDQANLSEFSSCSGVWNDRADYSCR